MQRTKFLEIDRIEKVLHDDHGGHGLRNRFQKCLKDVELQSLDINLNEAVLPLPVFAKQIGKPRFRLDKLDVLNDVLIIRGPLHRVVAAIIGVALLDKGTAKIDPGYPELLDLVFVSQPQPVNRRFVGQAAQLKVHIENLGKCSIWLDAMND